MKMKQSVTVVSLLWYSISFWAYPGLTVSKPVESFEFVKDNDTNSESTRTSRTGSQSSVESYERDMILHNEQNANPANMHGAEDQFDMRFDQSNQKNQSSDDAFSLQLGGQKTKAASKIARQSSLVLDMADDRNMRSLVQKYLPEDLITALDRDGNRNIKNSFSNYFFDRNISNLSKEIVSFINQEPSWKKRTLLLAQFSQVLTDVVTDGDPMSEKSELAQALEVKIRAQKSYKDFQKQANDWQYLSEFITDGKRQAIPAEWVTKKGNSLVLSSLGLQVAQARMIFANARFYLQEMPEDSMGVSGILTGANPYKIDLQKIQQTMLRKYMEDNPMINLTPVTQNIDMVRFANLSDPVRQALKYQIGTATEAGLNYPQIMNLV
jgi:hypothetical protein